MIKINLLGAAPPPARKLAAPSAPIATQAAMFLGALAVSFAIVGIVYKVWNNQIDDLTKRVGREKIRQSELVAVRAQNARYQQRLNDLETRINTIQALQNSRVGPVELMNALGNVVNRVDDLYLFTATPAGDRLLLKGESGTVNSMANFMADLKKSGSFEDVQLEQFFQDDQKDRLDYKFSLSCLFKPSNGAASPTAGASPMAAAPERGDATTPLAGVAGAVGKKAAQAMRPEM